MKTRFGKRDKSIVDALFLLALFGVFLICALFIVLFGAKIYKKTVSNSDINFNTRTAHSYISEKIRQNDNSYGITLYSDDSVIVLTSEYGDRLFNTYLYYYDGYLCEYTTNEGNSFNKEFGSKIMEINDMKICEISPNLYRFIITDNSYAVTDFYVSISSRVDNNLTSSNTKGGSNAD